MLPIVKIAIKQIRASMYFWIPNDKQAGFSGVPIHLMPHAEKAALKEPVYSPCSLAYNNYLSRTNEYKSIAMSVAKAEDNPSLLSIICASLPRGSLVCPVGYTCKVHKECGSVSLRILHRSLCPAWSGLSVWLWTVLSPLAEGLSWLHKDSFQVASYLRNQTISCSSILALIDVKDFYLSGEPHIVAKHISSYVGEKVGKHVGNLVFRALYFC